MKITLVGLGKIGLPLAVQYALKGNIVFGADISQATVDIVNAGKEPFPGEKDLGTHLEKVVGTGNLTATTETSHAVSESNVVVVAVPLFIDQETKPDYSAMDSATRSIGKGLRKGALVAYETTLPVGTTRKRLVPILEAESGLQAGKDFYVVFSPERVLTGRVFADLRKYPKLVGGIDPVSESKGVLFYESVLDFDERPDLAKPNGVWALGSSEAAEMAKLAETTYRDVNIALANQFAINAEKFGINVYEVIDACNSQHFSNIHQPGISVGGHCIPVYPHLYLDGDPTASIVEAARRTNKNVPIRMVDLVEEGCGSLVGKKIVILGVAYRAGVKEHAFSGASDLVALTKKRGGTPVVHDPLYSGHEIESLGFNSYTLGDPCDAVILHTSHSLYSDLEPQDFPGAKVFVDGRNFAPKKIREGLKTFVLGVGFE